MIKSWTPLRVASAIIAAAVIGYAIDVAASSLGGFIEVVAVVFAASLAVRFARDWRNGDWQFGDRHVDDRHYGGPSGAH